MGNRKCKKRQGTKKHHYHDPKDESIKQVNTEPQIEEIETSTIYEDIIEDACISEPDPIPIDCPVIDVYADDGSESGESTVTAFMDESTWSADETSDTAEQYPEGWMDDVSFLCVFPPKTQDSSKLRWVVAPSENIRQYEQCGTLPSTSSSQYSKTGSGGVKRLKFNESSFSQPIKITDNAPKETKYKAVLQKPSVAPKCTISVPSDSGLPSVRKTLVVSSKRPLEIQNPEPYKRVVTTSRGRTVVLSKKVLLHQNDQGFQITPNRSRSNQKDILKSLLLPESNSKCLTSTPVSVSSKKSIDVVKGSFRRLGALDSTKRVMTSAIPSKSTSNISRVISVNSAGPSQINPSRLTVKRDLVVGGLKMLRKSAPKCIVVVRSTDGMSGIASTSRDVPMQDNALSGVEEPSAIEYVEDVEEYVEEDSVIACNEAVSDFVEVANTYTQR